MEMDIINGEYKHLIEQISAMYAQAQALEFDLYAAILPVLPNL